MMTEDYLRKLEPLLPSRVRSWRAILAVADPPTRALLEQHIALVAHQRLHNPHDLFLSLPPRERAKGTVQLGTIRYDGPQWPFGISTDELLQHVAIFGRSGAGKTNILFHLLEQLTKHDIPFVFLDWKRTGRHLLPRLRARVYVYTPGRSLAPLPFNPFLPPPGLESRVYAQHVVDVLGAAYTLGDGAKSLLHKALHACNEEQDISPQGLLDYVRAVPDQERVRGWKISAIRALESLIATTIITTKASQERMVKALLEQYTIIELDGLSPSTKAFLLPLLCLWIYHARLGAPSREQLRLVVVVEEAHHVLYAHQHQLETTMEMLLRQCREIGIGMIVIDQHPHLLSSAAVGNTYTSITLNLKDPKDLNKAARISLLRSEDAHHLSTLPVGRGVVKLQDRWRQPFLVDFPHVPIDKGVVSDDLLRAYLGGMTALSALAQSDNNDLVSLGRPRHEDEAQLLNDIALYPDDGVDTRYRRLGMSADKGTRIKRRLLALGLIQEQHVPLGRTRRTLLRLTPRAESLPAGQHRHESIAHEYWKRTYADHFRRQDYTVEIEASRPAGGRVDVLATRESERIAIEIETGNSDTVENVRKDLLSGYTRVLVVATTQEAWVRVWHSLRRAGLVLPQISVVLRDRPQA